MHKQLPDEALVRVKTVLEYIPISRATFYSWVAQGKVSKPRKFGNISAWPLAEIRELMKGGADAE